jgi:hypothetical protein
MGAEVGAEFEVGVLGILELVGSGSMFDQICLPDLTKAAQPD